MVYLFMRNKDIRNKVHLDLILVLRVESKFAISI